MSVGGIQRILKCQKSVLRSGDKRVSVMIGAKGVFYCRVPKECFIVGCQKSVQHRVPKDLGAKSSGGNKNPGGKSSDAKNVVAVIWNISYFVSYCSTGYNKLQVTYSTCLIMRT